MVASTLFVWNISKYSSDLSTKETESIPENDKKPEDASLQNQNYQINCDQLLFK